MKTDEYVVEMRGISKRFPGILANDRVNLSLKKGEILALLGENGAGKKHPYVYSFRLLSC